MICGSCFAPVRKNDTKVNCKSCNTLIHLGCSNNNYCDACVILGHNKGITSYDMPDTIRRSHIEMYRTCPYQFYLEVIQGNVSPHTIYTLLGVDVHDIIDDSQMEEKELSYMQDRFKEKFKTYADELFEEVSREKMYERGLNSLKNYANYRDKLPHRAFRIEEKYEFTIEENLPKVNITLDRLDLIDEKLHLTDWKTGKVLVGKKIPSDLQAPLYIKAVQTAFPQYPVESFTFVYLDEDKTRVFQRVTDDVYECKVKNNVYQISITEKLREVNTLFSHMKSGNFNVPSDVKGMYFACKMCYQQKSGKCRGASEESWYSKTV